MPDPSSSLLEDAVHKLAPFLDEIVFVGGITLGLLITDKAAAPIRGTNDVSPRDLRDYLAEAASALLAESRFLNVLPGFVLDSGRVPIIEERLAMIAANDSTSASRSP